MKSRLTVLASSLCFLTVGLHAQFPPRQVVRAMLGYDPAKQVMLTTVHRDSGSTVYLAEVESVRRSPQWDGAGKVPLAPAEAVRTARDYADGMTKGFSKFQLDAVTLKRITSTTVGHRWYYMVSFQEDVQAMTDGQEWPETVAVCLLLDGTIVTPRKE